MLDIVTYKLWTGSERTIRQGASVAKIELRVCDVAPRPGEPVSEYRVTVDGRTVAIDLCAEHARPLLELLRSARSADPSVPLSATAPALGRRKNVRTLEEIEELKRARP
jgi:hypothetical protein